MPHIYRLANPGVTSVSHDGREHRVNAAGFLEIADADMSASLHAELTGSFGAATPPPEAGDDRARVSPPDGSDPATSAPAVVTEEEADRQILFARLDVLFNRRIDRRRSLQQLQEMLADHEARQARAPEATSPPS